MSEITGTKTMTAGHVSAPVMAPAGAGFSAATRRAVFLGIVLGAVVAGLVATGNQAGHLALMNDGAALTRLMRFMAVIKAGMAVAAAAVVLWRLAAGITLAWFMGYAICGAAMGVGPGLIWGMVHVGLGALLLHGGLLACIVLLWRDLAVGVLLADLVAGRRLRV